MPCDGVAVAAVKVALPEVGRDLEKPEVATAAADLLRGQGLQAEARGGSLVVGGYVLRCTGGRITGYAPAWVVNKVREAYERVAGVLTQERLAALIARQVEAEEQTWAQGHLVLRANL